jgi:hypothetical protein
VLATLGVPGSARAQCAKDVDCKGDRICSKGMCVDPNAASATPVQAQPVVVSPTVVQPLPAAPLVVPAGSGVLFQAGLGDDHFTVTVDGTTSCNTPCNMQVAPGHHRVFISGEADFAQDHLKFGNGTAERDQVPHGLAVGATLAF